MATNVHLHRCSLWHQTYYLWNSSYLMESLSSGFLRVKTFKLTSKGIEYFQNRDFSITKIPLKWAQDEQGIVSKFSHVDKLL